MAAYSKEFFERHEAASTQSAREVVPLVLELLHPASVVDVGCGLGSWLAVFRESGLEDILGVDGAWVNKQELLIPPERFLCRDLTKPLQLGREFDLVVSLEVAEHLPEEAAATFVDSLVGLSPVILFSAAIPFQGGKRHLNEQWPDYWAGLFRERGYVVIDALRKHIWQNERVAFYYAQNILLYVRSELLECHEALKSEYEKTNRTMLSLVHPKLLNPKNFSLRKVLGALPGLILNRVKGKMQNLFPR